MGQLNRGKVKGVNPSDSLIMSGVDKGVAEIKILEHQREVYQPPATDCDEQHGKRFRDNDSEPESASPPPRSHCFNLLDEHGFD